MVVDMAVGSAQINTPPPIVQANNNAITKQRLTFACLSGCDIRCPPNQIFHLPKQSSVEYQINLPKGEAEVLGEA